MTCTFDSEVYLHSWLLWPTVGRARYINEDNLSCLARRGRAKNKKKYIKVPAKKKRVLTCRYFNDKKKLTLCPNRAESRCIGCAFAAASPLTSSLARSEVKEEGPSHTVQIVNLI
jgi:hypothetical protein